MQVAQRSASNSPLRGFSALDVQVCVRGVLCASTVRFCGLIVHILPAFLPYLTFLS